MGSRPEHRPWGQGYPVYRRRPASTPNNGGIGHSTSAQTHEPAGVLAGGYTVCMAFRIVRVAGDLFSV